MNPQRTASDTFRASGFFALRTPLLPFDEFTSWGEGLESAACVSEPTRLADAIDNDRAQLRARLQHTAAQSHVREAIFAASPSLHEQLDAWMENPETKRGRKVEQSMCRYFARMTRRCTPFGLFAGCSVGTVADRTRLRLGPAQEYARHTRLDMEYLQSLATLLEGDASFRSFLRFFPNSSVYETGGRVRYAESRFDGNLRLQNLVAVDASDALAATLDRAGRGGAKFQELTHQLIDEDISEEEAEAFINELIDHQLLVSTLQPPVTGDDALSEMIHVLDGHPDADDIVAGLKRVLGQLGQIDAGGIGQRAHHYLTIAKDLEALPAPVSLSRLFQVDMTKPAEQLEIGHHVVAEVIKGVETLARINPAEDDPFARFKSDFTKRYGDAEVPLVEALDEEAGIGFMSSTEPSATATPLLAGVLFPQGEAVGEAWDTRHAFLLNKLLPVLSSGDLELRLTESDVDHLAADQPSNPPDATVAMGTLVAASAEAANEGDFQFFLQAANGPSGARMLGRFCQADPELRRHVEQHLREEESLDESAIFAEVVHLPEGRTGNILSRPLLRRCEIPFLGRSGADPESQIPVQDLLVSVEEGRVVLRSKRHGCRIVPRLTSAHNYVSRSLGIYKFLCALQAQGIDGSLAWRWGPLDACPFLPRVTFGRLVLSRARWRVSRDEINELSPRTGAELFRTVNQLRRERRLPRYVVVRDGDNELPIDLENIISVETLATLAKDRQSMELVELFPMHDHCVEGPEGRFSHELLLPLVRETATGQGRPTSIRPARPATAPQPRHFPPGSEWLYFNLYCGSATADRILLDAICGTVDQAISCNAIERWFFIRYTDPNPHLRVRFQGDPRRLQTEIAPLLFNAITPFQRAGLVWRVQQDTYQREVYRYGGDLAINVAEEIFRADSEAVLRLIECSTGDAGLQVRWMMALAGMHQLMIDFGMDLDQRTDLAKLCRDGFSREFRFSAPYKQQLGRKYRVWRRRLESWLDGDTQGDESLAYAQSVLGQRSDRIRHCAEAYHELASTDRLSEPLPRIIASLIHMHVNRMLPSVQRAQEMVLYDFLSRYLESKSARRRKGPNGRTGQVKTAMPV